MVKILPVNPVCEYLLFKDEIENALKEVLHKGEYILGEEVSSFEKEFACYVGSQYAVGVGSGTDALYLALIANNIGKGDEVITVSHTSVATVAAIVQTGAVPVFVDIDPSTYTMDESKILARLSKKTKCILPVHLYGKPAKMNRILEIAKMNGALVIEDCAHAHGCRYAGHHVGTFGAAGCFSFYPTKNLGGFGDGGMVVTNSKEIYDKVILLRQYGWKERYVSSCRGWNSRLDEIQAAILRVKLRHLDALIAQRMNIAGKYLAEISNKKVTKPFVGNEIHVFHLFVVRCSDRHALKNYLQDKGIGTLIHYPVPVHLQPGYFDNSMDLLNTEKASREVLSLPLYPGLDDQAVNYIIENINSF